MDDPCPDHRVHDRRLTSYTRPGYAMWVGSRSEGETGGKIRKKKTSLQAPPNRERDVFYPPVSLSLQLPAMISSVISIQLSDLHLDAVGFFDVSS